MMLKKKTNLGTLTARYKYDEKYPGFWIDLMEKDGKLAPICNIEYEQNKNCIQVIVYADGKSEEPTHIIEIDLNDVKAD